ncbi:MAG TPA: hypothetical protein VF909_18385, partial [Roseiflexaceae bacterium]
VLLDTIGGRMNATDRAIYSQNIASVRDLLGAPAFEAAWAQGQSLTIEQVVADAFDEQGCNDQPLTRL